MRKYLSMALCIIMCSAVYAQLQSPPPVDWKTDHHFLHFPIEPSEPIVMISDDDYSGEDWWHSVEKVYNSSEVHIGYIASGFSHFEDYDEGGTLNPIPLIYDEVSGSAGGWFQGSSTNYSCLPFYANPNPPLLDNPEGTGMQTIGYYDLTGTMVWCRVYNQGVFHKIVQSKDRQYFIAVGATQAIKDRKEHQWTNPGGEFLAYNPTSIDNDNTFEDWSANGLVSGDRKNNISVVCMNVSDGDVVWNYVYGSQAYGTVGTEGWRNDGVGFSLCAGPGSGSSATYRVVGRTRLISGGSVTQARTMFVMDIDDDGYVSWYESPLSSSTNKSVALDVIRNPSSPGEYYVTGFQSQHVSGIPAEKNTDIFLGAYTASATSMTWSEIIDATDDPAVGGFVTTGSDHACAGWSLDFDYENNLILGCLINGNWNPKTFIGAEADPRVYTILPSTTGFGGFERDPVPTTSTAHHLGTHDLRIAVTATADEGIAFTSSKLSATPWTTQASFQAAFPSITIPGSCSWTANYQLKGAYWDSDAIVYKYQDDGSGEWELKWNTTIDSDNPRAGYPGDVKKRECIFDIIEADDGGLVFTGNSSDNHDDYYIVKISNDCDHDMIATASVISGVSCYGSNDGSGSVSVTGGTAPYTYEWPSAETTATATSLEGGLNVVTVTDDNGCEGIAQITISEPVEIYLTSTQVDVLCNGASTGSIDLTAVGGDGSFTYSWSNSATTQDISGLTAGTYTVTVTDGTSCTNTLSVTLTEPTALSVSTVVGNHPSCAGFADGDATASATGGESPYTYLWSNSQTSANATGLAANTYTVTATDANGCTATATAVLTEPSAVIAGATVVNDPSCFGDSDGEASASPSGGSGSGYTYLWSNSSTNNNATGLSDGTYSVTVTDGSGCTGVGNVTINDPLLLTATVTHTDPLCVGSSDGDASAGAGGGTMPYTYAWSNAQTTATATGLTAGTYTVTVTDDNGCTATGQATLTDPTPLASTASASPSTVCAGDLVTLTASYTGGTGSPSFAWGSNNGYSGTGSSTTDNPTTSGANDYVVTATDANGCTDVSAPATVTVNALPVLTFTDVDMWEGAEDFVMLHGEPVGGTYAGTGVTFPDRFSPQTAGSGTYSITYTYTDNNGCTNTIIGTFDVSALCNTIGTGTFPPSSSGPAHASDWPKGIESSNSVEVNDLTNNTDFDLFFTGYFEGRAQIGHRIFESNGGKDILVGKFNNGASTSSGGCGLEWVDVYGGSGDDIGHSVDYNEDGGIDEIVIGGEVEDGYDFNGAAINLSNDRKGFVLKRSSFVYSSVNWVRVLGGDNEAVCAVYDACITGGGLVGITGFFNVNSNPLDFGGTTFSNTSTGDDMFVGVYDQFGGELEFRPVEDIFAGEGIGIESIGDELLAIGNTTSSLGMMVPNVNPFGYGNLLYMSSNQHMIMARFTTPYNGALDAQVFGGAGDVDVTSFESAFPAGPDRFHATGAFSDQVDFGSGTVISVYNGGSYTEDGFVAQYDANGNCFWTQPFGDSDDGFANSSYVSHVGNLYAGFHRADGGLIYDFIVKMDPNTGNPTGTQLLNGTSTTNSINGLASMIPWSPNGDLDMIMVGGGYSLTFNFNNAITSAGGTDGYIGRLAFTSTQSDDFKRGEDEVVFLANDMKLYPNPTQSEVNLIAPDAGAITVLDISGKVVYTGTALQGLNTLNLADVGAGMYFVTLTTATQNYHSDLIVH